ncbi:endonuclease/exonuclease/phosphatase family protein [Actinoplanes awajinensis]|uniref:endonuclease/exonuclease/phosphatase family protein n=1 Tax=Actinoplanes awajinensis TaxID=135946 RepID=UPI0009FBCD72|nr:endonuclease/exonuclease/phosphatase family protein [Actinoplanes awajinensis]
MRLLVLLLVTVFCAQTAGDAAAQEPPRFLAPRESPAPPLSPARSAMDRLAGPAAPADLDVMTFNLRYAADNRPNSWAQRRPVTRALLRAEHPDLIGTQEGLPDQLRDIDADLGDRYGRIGLGREGGDVGEHMAIYFDRQRLRPGKSGNYWLSETPQIPASTSWNSFRIRMVTWVLFTDLRTGRRFYAVNTHLDNNSAEARRHSARLIQERLAGFDPLPVVLTGDFNSPAAPDSEVYQVLTGQAGLRDSWTTASRRGPAYGTIHNYQDPIPDAERDDWILTSPGVTVRGALMNLSRPHGQFPSDHLPIQVRLHLP